METTTRQPQMGLTFEQVWAALMELSVRVDKTTENVDNLSVRVDKTTADVDKMAAKVDRTTENVDKLSARVDQTSAAVEKTTADVDKLSARVDQTTAAVDKMAARVDKMAARVDQMAAKVDKVSENVGGLNRSMGELIETLIAAKLWKKFDAYAYNLKRAYKRVPIYDENSNLLTDIDILLSNGEYVMAVEVKRELDREKDIDHHLRRMELIKEYPPAECKGKKLLGAIAGGTVEADAAEYAHSVGFFVLELTGESVQLAKAPVDFIVKQW
ncbi:MAG: hypothetical protein Ta2B_24630 [Termitinemataceae bacterium]|nr:MAG: hypothetical protein Ta2B_24630 [Termitinemataceae bacterium]